MGFVLPLNVYLSFQPGVYPKNENKGDKLKNLIDILKFLFSFILNGPEKNGRANLNEI